MTEADAESMVQARHLLLRRGQRLAEVGEVDMEGGTLDEVRRCS